MSPRRVRTPTSRVCRATTRSLFPVGRVRLTLAACPLARGRRRRLMLNDETLIAEDRGGLGVIHSLFPLISASQTTAACNAVTRACGHPEYGRRVVYRVRQNTVIYVVRHVRVRRVCICLGCVRI